MTWRFPERKAHRWPRRAVAAVLILLVFAGGWCPALYGDLLPHEHIFINGPPPAGWEHHEHPNPLFTLLGSPDHAQASGEALTSTGMNDAPAAGGNPASSPLDPSVAPRATPPGTTVHVLSVFNPLLLVLTAVAIAATTPIADPIAYADRGWRVSCLTSALHDLGNAGPPLPPPRRPVDRF